MAYHINSSTFRADNEAQYSDSAASAAVTRGVDVISPVYHTGGYWLAGTAMMMGTAYSAENDLTDIAFDPLEELVWGITRMGRLTGFYSASLQRYVTTTIPLQPSLDTSGAEVYGNLKQIFPSPRPEEHAVYVLASNALHVYNKFGLPRTCAVDKAMVHLECLAVTNANGAAPGSSGFASGVWVSNTNGAGEIARVFLGGLQSALLELDATERWGEVIRTLDVGPDGAVVLRPFSCGLCAGNVDGKVLVIDPRTSEGVVSKLDAHTGEISDITVPVPNGYTLVTCGWSRRGEAGLRVDRLLKVYDLRFSRGQLPLSVSLDPCFARFIPGCMDRLLTASQTGAFQTIRWGDQILSPSDLGQLWLNYDRVTCMDLSQNGQCSVFGTETGQIQIYIAEGGDASGQFNPAPVPTEFASSLTEGLWPTNSYDCMESNAMPASAGAFRCAVGRLECRSGQNCEVPGCSATACTGRMNNCFASGEAIGANLLALCHCAGEAAALQVVSPSLHQPMSSAEQVACAGGDHECLETMLLERCRAEAANETMKLAYKPVDYDDQRFSLASVPFSANPPAVVDADGQTGSSADWPEDLCRPRARIMLPVDEELLANASRMRTVRKPAGWGNVWHPYRPLDEESDPNEAPLLGRFISARTVHSPSTSGGS